MGEMSARHAGAIPSSIGRAYQLCALDHEIRRLGQRIERVRATLSDNDIVGVDIVHSDARIVERVEQPRLTDNERRAAGCLIAQESRRCERARIEMPLGHVEPHACELLIQFAWGIAAVICQKQIFLLLLVKPVEKLSHTGQNLIAVIYNSVHIADEAFFRVKIYCRYICHYISPAFRILRIIYHRFVKKFYPYHVKYLLSHRDIDILRARAP